MRLIVDTNVLISALLKDSITREILLLPFFDFYLPEFALDEINRHKERIVKISGLSVTEIDMILGVLLESVTIAPEEEISPHLTRAKEIIGHIDPGDIPFVALALAFDNDGIWSNDSHFDSITEMKVWKTKDIFKYLEKL